MAIIIGLVQYIMAHYLEIVGAISLAISGLLALAIMIPGEQPDKFLQSIVDLIGKVSRK